MPFPEETLRLGCRGKNVAKMKKALWETGFLESYGDENLFGLETYRAIIRFQAAMHLPVTGESDEETRKALFS